MNYDYYGRKPPLLSLYFSLSISLSLSLSSSIICTEQRAFIAFIFITLRQLLIIRDIDNRFSPSGVVNKKTKKRLKMGIAFAVSRFGDNAYRRFFRAGNADDNFRGLARWICRLYPAFVALVLSFFHRVRASRETSYPSHYYVL